MTVKTATFSNDRKHRYDLFRSWDDSKPYAMFIGLNPSTADETNDDPTIRRCINFCKSWGYGGFCMTNIFAYRATKPEDMKAQSDPIGEANNCYILSNAMNAGIVIGAWGTHGLHLERHYEIISLIGLDRLYCLGINGNGTPKHPLYLKSDLKPILYRVALEESVK